VRGDLDALRLPIGWTKAPLIRHDSHGKILSTDGEWLEAIAGWLVTAFAASLGAPFWFDLLNKIMVIRSTVKPHEKSPEESSEDRQLGKEPVPAIAGKPSPDNVPRAATTPPDPAAAPTQTSSTVPPPTASLPPDAMDGCDVEVTDFTADEDLPAAEGGVA
jgi:hypothetical protein